MNLLYLILVFVLMSIPANAKSQLNLGFELEAQMLKQDPEGDVWQTLQKKSFLGVGGFQFHIAGGKYRLKITAHKPYDIKGVFKVRMPGRVDGVVAPAKKTSVSIILGPHKGCPAKKARCLPLTKDDFGNLELRLDLKKAKQTSLGIALLRPYDTRVNFAIRPALRYEDLSVPCGAKVPKGWWIFASSMKAESDPISSISLCVREPDGDVECAEEKEESVRVKLNEEGLFQFIVWNESADTVACEIEAVST